MITRVLTSRQFLNTVCRVLAIAALASSVPISAASRDAFASPSATIPPAGETLYRLGILPSGQRIKTANDGSAPGLGLSSACVSCHLRSGLGSVDGDTIVPPINARMLYQKRQPFIPGSEFVPFIANYAKYLPERPAYTDESLATVISTGIDPAGRSIRKTMPRFDLAKKDMADLISYLRSLSVEPSPGVTDEEVRFATVIVEGTDPVAVESMLAPLQFSIDRKNSLSRAAERNSRVARMGYNMLGDLSALRFSLSRWILRGKPDTWRAQLNEYYAKEPVFALLGGISPGEWEPVHRFCEENRIPNLFPVVDYPVITANSWYTLYFSRGVRQEGESAARYLHGMSELFGTRPVLQITRASRRGEAIAEGFRRTWVEAGHIPASEIRLAEGERLSPERLQHLIANQKPAALVVWDDEATIQTLRVVEEMAARPGIVIASASCLGDSLWTIPETLRNLVYLTYPYRLPQEEFRFDAAVKKVVPGKPLAAYDGKILRQSYMAGEVLGKAFMEMRGEYHRDFLLDTIGMMKEMNYPLYERVSFGAEDRFASKGCFLVQLGKGQKPQLERRSEWVIP